MANRYSYIDDIAIDKYPRARYYYAHPDGFVGFKTKYGYDWWGWSARDSGYIKSGSTNGREGAKKKSL